jgi:hypothetical protein
MSIQTTKHDRCLFILSGKLKPEESVSIGMSMEGYPATLVRSSSAGMILLSCASAVLSETRRTCFQLPIVTRIFVPSACNFSRFEIPWSRYPPVDFVEDRNVTDVGRDSKVVRSGAIEIALISLSEVWHSQYLMSTSQRRRFANMRASDDVSSRTPGSTFVATISATG